MKLFGIDYVNGNGALIAKLLFNNRTRRSQKEDIASLPGLKATAETPDSPERCDVIMRAMCKKFNVDTEVRVAIYNLLTGGSDTGDWRIVEVELEGGCLVLCLADKNGSKQRTRMHGTQFQKDTVMLKFEGSQGELALTLRPTSVCGAFMNDFGNDAFSLRSPSDPRNYTWYLQDRQETTW